MNRQQFDNGGGRSFDRDRDYNNGSSGGGFERGNFNNGSSGYNKYGSGNSGELTLSAYLYGMIYGRFFQVSTMTTSRRSTDAADFRSAMISATIATATSSSRAAASIEPSRITSRTMTSVVTVEDIDR